MKKVLFISIAFPPKNDPECLQAAKYFHYLQLHELAIDVVTTSSPTLNMPYDKELESYAQGYHQKIEIDVPENKYFNYIARKSGINRLNRPDSKFKFIDGFNKVITELEDKPEIIYSRSFPISSSLLAARLAEYYKVPWVLHLSDPWTLSPMHTYGHKTQMWHEDKERSLFGRASALCFTSGQTKDAYANKYPEWSNKMHIFPNVIDDTLQTRTKGSFNTKLRICYTGGLSGSRSPEFILKALKNLHHSNPEIENLMEVVFAGSVDRKNKNISAKYPLPFVKFLGPLPFSKALELQKSADVLLLIDTPVKQGEIAHFLPSKLPDYLMTGKRILALTNRNSPSTDFLTSELADLVFYGEEHLLQQKFEILLQEFLRGNVNFFNSNRPLPESFSAKFQANRLCQLFDKLLE